MRSNKYLSFGFANELISFVAIVGYAIIDGDGVENYRSYEDKYEAFNNFVETNLYPYEYLYVDRKIKIHKDNKIFESFISYTEEKTDVYSKVILKNGSNIDYVNIALIIYNKDVNNYYLNFGSNHSASSFKKLKEEFKIEYNEILKREYNFTIEIEKANNIINSIIYEYDLNNNLLKETDLSNIDNFTLNIDTLFFIIVETKTNSYEQSYLSKKVVQHNEFDELYMYVTPDFGIGSFATPKTIIINSHIK